MEFTNKPLKWDNAGAQPSEEQKQSGYAAGGKLPAAHLNYLIKNKQLVEEELQEKITEIDAAVINKVDKVEGKGLSSNDYTNEEKQKLAELGNVQVEDSLASNSTTKALSANQGKILNESKVAVAGGTITGNLTVNGTFTNAGINATFDTKVDKVGGKGLSSNDYTNEEKQKLAGLNNIQVVDNLTTPAPNLALSAKQGKVLNENKLNYLAGFYPDLDTMTTSGIYAVSTLSGTPGKEYPIQIGDGHGILEVYRHKGFGYSIHQKLTVYHGWNNVHVFARWCPGGGDWTKWSHISTTSIEMTAAFTANPEATVLQLLNIANVKFNICCEFPKYCSSTNATRYLFPSDVRYGGGRVMVEIKSMSANGYCADVHDFRNEEYRIELFHTDSADKKCQYFKPCGMTTREGYEKEKARWYWFTGGMRTLGGV